MFIIGDIVRLKPKEQCSRGYGIHQDKHTRAKVVFGTFDHPEFDYTLIAVEWLVPHATQTNGEYRASDFELASPDESYEDRQGLVSRFKQVADEL